MVLKPCIGQDEGGGSKDDPGNEGRRCDQVQQTSCRSETRSVFRFEISRHGYIQERPWT